MRNCVIHCDITKVSLCVILYFQNRKYYSTKFEPPKKDPKERKLSDGIRRFLAQKEEEERKQDQERKKNYTELMSQRSDRDKNKIRKMLKVTKSANRSVLDDAVSKTDTAVTLEGPDQPDEDDYGYTSHEAGALYKNLMNKYKSIPEDTKFAQSSGQSRSNADLKSTKDRVREAIMREKEDEKLGRKRSTHSDAPHSSALPSEHKHRSRKNLYDPKSEREDEDRKRKEEEEQRRKMRMKKAPPPIMDFQKLLKLAEEKQYEPVKVEAAPKPKEPERRLLTNKEKREIEQRKKEAEERERRRKHGNSDKPKETNNEERKQGLLSNGRIPKLNGYSTPVMKAKPSNGLAADSRTSNGSSMKRPTSTMSSSGSKTSTPISKSLPSSSTMRPGVSSKPSASHQLADRKTVSSKSKIVDPPKGSAKPQAQSSGKAADMKSMKSREFPPKDTVRSREFPPKDTIKSRELPPKDTVKSREFPPKDVVRSREFPPRDVARGREFPPRDMQRGHPKAKKKPMSMQKRRILDDSESEYDSELDDFIDDDEPEEDYSRHIRDIFGYDKARYRNEDYDSDNMESNFAQQQREEFISKKLGMMEDLEDMRMEEEENKRKAAKRRRLK